MKKEELKKYPPEETTLGTKSFLDFKSTVEIDTRKELTRLHTERRDKQLNKRTVRE